MSIKKFLAAGAAAMAISISASAAQPADTLSVAVGTTFGYDILKSLDRLSSLGISVNKEVFLRTLKEVFDGAPTGMSPEEAGAWLDNYIAATRPPELPDAFTPESQQKFLSDMAAQPGAVTLPGGVVFLVETEGEGPKPVDGQTVRLKYVGRFSDGTQFDATDSPIEFGVNDVVGGFTEGLKEMKPGGRYRIIIPADLAYGSEGIPGAVPANAALDFTVDLISAFNK